MSRQATRLRELLDGPGVVRLAGAHNALGAKLVQQAGFDGVWSSGLEISASQAVPDANILTMSELLSTAQSMVDTVDIPVVADCDTGFGNSNNVIHMVRRFEAAGVAGVCIEDKQYPKVNSFVAGRQELVSVAEFVGKIMAARNSRRSPDFVVIARIEALIAGFGPDEALRRALAYAEAGADAILIHSKASTAEELASVASRADRDVPLVAVPTTYFRATVDELAELGVKVVIYANHGLRAAIPAMSEVLAQIRRTGSSASVEDRLAPMSTVFALQGFPLMKEQEKTYLRSEGPPTRAVVPAAGDHLGERSLRHIAADTPIAMLDICGKPLLRRQMEVLGRSGINDVTVIGGYRSESIDLDGIELLTNHDWESSGEMTSILLAGNPPDTHTLVAYADILFEEAPLAKLLASGHDITLLVDRTFDPAKYDPERRPDLVRLSDPPRLRRRTLAGATFNDARQIGKSIPPDEADSEFSGLALFSVAGLALLREVYEDLRQSDLGGAFHEARSLATASLTDMIQELIDRDHRVACVEVTSGWMEIHSFEDYRLACRLVSR